MNHDTRNEVADAPAYGIQPPRYRLPDATRLGRVVLQVSDLARSVAYYEQVLGLRTLHRDERSATLGVDAAGGGAGAGEPVVELRERAGATPVPRRGRLGLYHFAVLLPDRASLGRFIEHLRRLGIPAGMSDHAVSEAVYLSDPDGLGIEVYADRPRSTWRHARRELQMVTEPLDVAAVVSEAGDEEWAGAPAGTVIGHVHLFVGDLDPAARFYHEGMGFDRVVWSYPGALFMSAGGYHHHLGTNTWAAHAAPAGEDDARLLEWVVLVPEAGDVADVARSLEQGESTVERSDDALVATDPWGTRVRVTTSDRRRD